MAKKSKNSGWSASFSGAKRTNIIISAVVAVGVAITGYTLLTSSAAAPTASVSTTTTAAGTVNFEIGFDHTQTSHLASDAGGNSAAVKSAKNLLNQLNAPQNVHIMGFGAGNPEPSKGRYDWASLDSRVMVIGDTVGEAQRMITLCTAPGWMKGTDDWNMDAAVQSSHFGDFASLSAAVAQRYDGNHRDAQGNALPKVVYFDVWNEMKGFWNNSKNRWDYEGYTTMYNQVYTAIKNVRPDAKIGGPYPSFGPSQYNPSGVKGAYGTIDQRTLDVMTYWLKNKKGADFISLDGGPQTDSDKGTVATDGFTAGSVFADLAKWIRSLNDATYPGAKTLPIRWVEFYPGIGSATGQKAAAISIDNAITAGLAGVSSVYVWEPEGDASGNGQYTGKAVWTDTSRSGGGQPTAFYSALKTLHDTLPVGTQLYSTTVSGPVTALATKDKVLLISKSAVTLNVDVNGATVSLSPYEVAAVSTTPSTGGGGSTPTPPPTSSNTGAFVGIASKCLDNAGSRRSNGNKIQLYTCNGTGAQKWTVNSNGTITNSNGSCLDAKDAGITKGTVVQLWQCDGTKAQQWNYDKSAHVIYYANDSATDRLCLDDKHAGTTNGTQIQVYTCNGTAAQKWTLTAQ